MWKRYHDNEINNEDSKETPTTENVVMQLNSNFQSILLQTSSCNLQKFPEILKKFCCIFHSQDFSQFTSEKHKNVVNLIIICATVRQSSLQWMKICSFYYSLLRVFLPHVFFLQQHFDSACSSRGKNINIKRWNQFIQLKGLTFKDRTTQCFCMLS